MSDLFGAAAIATLPPDGEKGREERGAFYTPDALALALCRTLRNESVGVHHYPRRIFEPGCGGGAFLRAARETWRCADLAGVDLVPACNGPGRVWTGDLFNVVEKFNLIIGNPDFGIAEKAVRHCLGLLEPGGTLAFLLRCGFLASSGRVPLFRSFPLRAIQPIAQRPSFAKGATDLHDYALFVWHECFSGRGEILPPLMWRG